MPSTRSLRSHATPRSSLDGQNANMSPRSGRLTRGAAVATIDPAPSVTVSRSSPGASPGAKSIHLTVKMSSSKLRQVTNSRSSRATASASSRHNIFAEDPVVHGKRSSRSNRNLKEVSEDEEDEDVGEEDDEEVDDSEDAAGEEEELDADGDLDMDDETPQPAVTRRNNRQQQASAASKSRPVKPVEEKEMELADDDDDDENEELSEMDSDAEGEPEDTMLQDEEMGEDVEEGDEGDEVDEEEEGMEEEAEEEEEDDDGLGSDDDSTLDLTKLTKRQRGSLGTDFLQLPMEPQVKKHLTAEEHAMRRAEMARRRKNLSEKRNEEEKMDTINRLLKKQAPKRRGRVPVGELGGEATPDVAVEPEKADATFIRWISATDGCKVAIPTEMLGTPASRPFGGFSGVAPGRKLIEEV